MGFSDKPGDGRYAYTLDSRVADLDAWLGALGVECVDIVAHDWGGMIASAWMVANADRVRRIVLMNTAAFRNPRGRTIPPTLKLARDSALGAFLVRGLNAFSRGATHLAVERKMAKDVREGYTLPYDSWDNRIATLRFVQDIPLEPGDPAWRTIESTEALLQRLANKPIFLPWGLKDFVFDEKFLDRFIEAWPHAEVERYPEAGHYLLEDAGDAVIRRIVDFLGA